MPTPRAPGSLDQRSFSIVVINYPRPGVSRSLHRLYRVDVQPCERQGLGTPMISAQVPPGKLGTPKFNLGAEYDEGQASGG
jgi:hypothetical protein